MMAHSNEAQISLKAKRGIPLLNRWKNLGATSRPVRFLIGSAVLMEIAIAMTISLILYQLRQVTLDEGALQTIKMARVIAEQTTRALQGVDLVMAGIAQELSDENITTVDTFNGEKNKFQTFAMLREKVRIVPQLDALSLINLDGNLVTFSRYYPIPTINVSDRDYFNVLHNSHIKSFISVPVQNRGNGIWTIYLARRFEAPDGKLIGLLLGSISLRYFENFFQDAVFGVGNSISLVRNDGVLLARFPAVPFDIGRAITVPTIPANSGNAVSLRKIGDIDHIPEVVSRYRLTDYPLTINVIRSESAILETWRTEALIIGGAGSIAALLVLICTWLFARELITHEKISRAEVQIVLARNRQAEAEAMSATKSQFLANMSHELRTPLNAIIGFSDLMLGELIGPISSPKYREYLTDIHGAGIHLLAIVNDILEFSRAEARQITFETTNIDVTAIIDETCRMLRPQADQLGVILANEHGVNLPRINSDPTRLKQVLVNLISNAIKFSPAGKRVTVESGLTRNILMIRIRDNGIGIAAEDIPKVLAPFGQVESALSRQHHGTGLGLPLSKMIVELLGGTLELRSVLGNGTTVIVKLPHPG